MRRQLLAAPASCSLVLHRAPRPRLPARRHRRRAGRVPDQAERLARRSATARSSARALHRPDVHAAPRSTSSRRPVGRRRRLRRRLSPAQRGSNLGPDATRTCSHDGRASASPPTASENGLAAERRGPGRRGHRVGLGPRPAHLAGERAPAGAAGRRRARADARRRCSTLVDEHTDGPRARVPRRAGRQRARAQPRPRPTRMSRSAIAHGARRRSASTSAPRPASARPSRCSTRAGVAASAAPTSSSASSRPTAAPNTAEQLGDLEVVPAASDRLPRRDVRGDGRRRGPRPPAARSRSSTSSRTPTSRARGTRSAGRTSRSCSTPASTSSRRSTSSTSSR